MMYSIRENKKLVFGGFILAMLFTTIICLIVRIAKVNEVIGSNLSLVHFAPRDWAIVALTFCLIAFFTMIGSMTSIHREGEFGNNKANSLFYGALVIAIIASSITLGSAHDDWKTYTFTKNMNYSGNYGAGSNAAISAGMSWISSVGIPFIPMVISSTVQGLILIVSVLMDISENSTGSVDMATINARREAQKLSERSFQGNVRETMSSFEGHVPPKAPKKTKGFTEEEFQAKLNKELGITTEVKVKKESTSFDEMVENIAKAEKLLKSKTITQKEFNDIKAKEIAKHK